MSTSLILTVEIQAGTSEEMAAAELSELARTLGIIVEAKHSDVTMCARPFQTPRDVLEEFRRAAQLQRYPEDSR